MNITKIAYNFLPSNGDDTTIEIFDAIANKKSHNAWTDKDGTEVTPHDFQEKLNAITTPNITIRMNSGGGEVTAANVIAVAIQEARKSGKKITCKIVGMCASAAVQIAISCDKVIAHESALIMIHNPKTFLYGYHSNNDLKSIDNMLTAVKDGILNYYTKKTGMTKQKLSNLMDEEYYMDGKKAVELGFADSLMFEEDGEDEVVDRVQSIVNCYEFDHLPEKYKAVVEDNISQTTKGEEDMEIKSIADLTTNFPELVNQLRAEAVAEVLEATIQEGVQRERKRLQSIDEFAGKISAELLNRAKYETFATAETVAMEAIKTGSFSNTTILNGMAQESVVANQVAGCSNEGVVTAQSNDKQNATAHATNVAEKYFTSIGKGGNK